MPTHRPLRAALAVTLVTALLAACGGPAPDTTTSPTASPTVAPIADDRSPQEQLVAAVTGPDYALAASALDAGADPSLYDEVTENSPLRLAVIRDDAQMTELLLEAGARIEWEDFGYSELQAAAQFGGAQVAQLLLDYGAHPDGIEPFLGAPLATAANEGNTDVMLVLLEAGALIDVEIDLGDDTTNPLSSAAYGGELEVVQLLIAWGADPTWTSREGRRAVDLAAGRMHHDVYEYLLQYSDDE